MSNNTDINIKSLNRLVIIEELITKSIEEDRDGDDEAGHSAEDAALHAFVRMIVSDEYSINDIKDIALKLNNSIRRKDRGARWCA